MVGHKPRVLILSNEQDVSVDWVVRELRRRDVEYLRLNTERSGEFDWICDPISGTLDLRNESRSWTLDSSVAVWFRRPEMPTAHWVAASESEIEFGSDQWRWLILGLSSFGSAHWINDPFRNRAAESKLVQLRLAKRIGLVAPDTIVTNSREDALTFLTMHGDRGVAKALHSPLVINEKSEPMFVFTEGLSANDVRSGPLREGIPFILQREVRPKKDIRVTVIDEQVFAAAVADERVALDWRTLPRPWRSNLIGYRPTLPICARP